MQFFTIATLFLATAFAAPSQDSSVNSIARRGPNSFCPGGLQSVPQCCSADVLGVADLDCKAPSAGPSKCKSFQALCAADGGRQAKCCAVPVAGQALLCVDAVGGN